LRFGTLLALVCGGSVGVIEFQVGVVFLDQTWMLFVLDFFSVAYFVGVGFNGIGVIVLSFLSSRLFLTLSRAMRFC